MKNAVYYIILNYSAEELYKHGEFFISEKEAYSILKESRKIYKILCASKTYDYNKTIQKIKSMETICNELKLSHEILMYICLDQLVNIERDTTTRVKLGHLDLSKTLQAIENSYKEDLFDHYKFFNALVDIWKKDEV